MIDLSRALLGADACLALEDGRVFFGHAFGARARAEGEVVFNTSMAGYQEILTDPSYRGQMVVLTHPQVGNYGVQQQASESTRPWVAALIVRDLARSPHHWLMTGDLDGFLSAAGVPGLQGVDTRALTKHLRTHGTMRAALGSFESGLPLPDQVEELVARARATPPLSEKNLVAEVSNPSGVGLRTDRQVPVSHSAREPAFRWTDQRSAGPIGAYSGVDAQAQSMGVGPGRPRIAVIDCGIKHNIVRSLEARGVETRVLSWNARCDEVLGTGAEGVVISNGPGDPVQMQEAARLTIELLSRGVPLLGICLGHQIFGLAAAGTTSRLRFGHHGGNHPVQDLATGRVYITSQNHEFQVDAGSIRESSGFFVSMVNLNDGSVEGLAHRELSVFSVQYHPEGCPGPQDNQYVFERFLDMVAHPASGQEALGRQYGSDAASPDGHSAGWKS